MASDSNDATRAAMLAAAAGAGLYRMLPATPAIQAILDSVGDDLAAKGLSSPTAVEYRDLPYRYGRLLVTVSYADGSGEQRANVQLSKPGEAWVVDSIS